MLLYTCNIQTLWMLGHTYTFKIFFYSTWWCDDDKPVCLNSTIWYTHTHKLFFLLTWVKKISYCFFSSFTCNIFFQKVHRPFLLLCCCLFFFFRINVAQAILNTRRAKPKTLFTILYTRRKTNIKNKKKQAD